MTSNEVRSSFLKFFEGYGHRIVPSSSLVPIDDPTLLFTNAGMNQFKDLFLGRERRDSRRATTAQKCMRVSGKHNDLDNVGPSLRHHTFFEMLGNFSFGDYFKAEAILYAWQLLTDVWRLPPERLFATIFQGESGIPRDDEAYHVWRRLVPAERIAELGLAENFWAMGETGPCGRCSEIHYYRGADVPCPERRCRGIECSCDRYVEIWNNVFMEFERQPEGALKPLPAPSIDTGMGLERIVAVLQGKLSNYDTDLFTPLLKAITSITGVTYGPHMTIAAEAAGDVSMRVIADHIRATTFLVADGVLPSNEWRGYVLRKIMRRAMRHGKHLMMREPFLYQLVDVTAREMGNAYPELRSERDRVLRVVRNEEERFDQVLNDGLPRLEAVIAEAEAGSRTIAGDEAFRLYDTYGLPLDFIEDLASQRGLVVDRVGFERAMSGQREKSRANQAFGSKTDKEFVFASDDARQALLAAADRFEGYATTSVRGVPVVAIFDAEQRQVDALQVGASGYIALERTPFYVEAGGQVSDRGRIFAETGAGEASVEGMTRLAPGGLRLHRVRMAAGRLAVRDLVTAEVDRAARDATRRNHTATHLLHAALRRILGSHVKQAGSLVAPDRLRFDFTHFEPLSTGEIEEIERLVNGQISANTEVKTDERSTQEAIADGAMALFGEKYGDRVRVVSVPGFSLELCGGTHCKATGDIGLFLITQESGIAAGVRRIEAVTGEGAIAAAQRHRTSLDNVLKTLGVPAERAQETVERLQADIKRLGREVEALKVKAAMGAGQAQAAEDTVDVGGVKMVARRVAGLEKGALRNLADSLRDRLGQGIVVLASDNNGKVALVVSVSKDLIGRLHAGQIVKEIAAVVGGGGGGRPDFAEAGGRQPEKIDELLSRSREVVRTMLERPA